MIIQLINRFKKNISIRKDKKLRSNLLMRNISIGEQNKIHPLSLLDTSLGGHISIGNSNEILNGCLLMTYGGKISIDSGCSINPYTIIYGHGKGTRIGKNVLIAGHCMLIPANHIFSRTDIPINQQGTSSKGIIIEDDVWIAAGCKILDGVTIGKGSIIAAGTIVSKSVEPYSIVAGVPSKVLKMRQK